VLSIGKLARGQEGYYLGSVVRGVEDYYLAGQHTGRWIGAGAEALGLAKEVAAESLSRILEGAHPDTSDPLRPTAGGGVPGFDLTFRAPKSVSVLYGISESSVAARIAAAHTDAVEAALGYLEREAVWTRRGHGGLRLVKGEGLVGAVFMHRTSRAGDPHLHSHVVVANTVRGADGAWATLDGRHLYWHAKTAGYLYEAHLRHRLGEELRIGWGPVVNGIADVTLIPDPVLRTFSKRREEIEAQMAEVGATSAKAAQAAALLTRRTKSHEVDPDSLRTRWRAEAAEAGLRLHDVAAALTQPPRTASDAIDIDAIAVRLLSPTGLTAAASTFDRRDVLRAIASSAIAAPIDAIERATDRLLMDPDVVAVDTRSTDAIRSTAGRTISRRASDCRWTTAEHLALEARTVDGVLERRSTGVAVAIAPARAQAAGGLAPDQAAVIEHLCGSGNGVDVLVAAAGTGKTTTLAACAAAWRASGIEVQGATLAARAARELETTGSIASTTITRLLHRLDEGPLPAGSVLVIDEAGMADTRTLARLLDHAAAARAKVVLVGDPHQLPEIGAGGLLAGLATRLPLVELTENRRQRQLWERQALALLRSGDHEAALGLYDTNGRITTAATHEEAVAHVVGRWLDARREGLDAVMLAATNADVTALNRAGRAATTDYRHGPTITVGQLDFQAGDFVMPLRNDRRLGVVNGDRGIVLGVDTDHHTLTARFGTNTVTIDHHYLTRGHLAHAYASTVHKAQGLTCDATFLLAGDDLNRELGYVAMSRGRSTNHITACGPLPDLERHAPTTEPTATDRLAAALGTSRAQQLALDLDERSAYASMSTAALVRDRRYRLDRIAQIPPDPIGRIGEVQARRDATAAALAGLGAPRRRWGRAGAEQADRRLLLTEQVAARDRHLESLRADLDRRNRAVIERAPDRAALAHIDQELDRRASHRVDAGAEDPEHYLCRTLGPRPTKPKPADAWTRAALTIERYRTTFGITSADALGPKPGHPLALIEWHAATDAARRINPDVDDTPLRQHRGRGIA
jgi:conjugative relaxase-like TrwC/TraI family protein